MVLDRNCCCYSSETVSVSDSLYFIFGVCYCYIAVADYMTIGVASSTEANLEAVP